MTDSLRNSSTTRLERRPEATAYQVDDLLLMARDGRLRVPRFQRGLRWRDRDRLDLLDSIYRGFPIGTLLFWKRSADAASVSLGDLSLDAPARDDALWIVDGQQRIATLASTLLVPSQPDKRAVHFNLETEEFIYARPSADPSARPELVPVFDLFDSTRLISWLAQRSSSTSADWTRRALDCGKRLREYRVPGYVVETSDEDVLRTVFDRTNRTGRRLDDTDVFTALFSSTSSERDPQDLSRIVSAIASTGFGRVDESTVLRALRAVADVPLDKDFTKALRSTEVPAILERTEAALVRTAHFMRDVAKIPHAALVPYELPIVVLARFFDAFDRPRPRNFTLLRRYVWRGAWAGELSGATVSLRQHVDAVDRGDEDAATQSLLALVARPGAEALSVALEPYRFNTAKTKLGLCAMAALRPRDLRSGDELELASLLAAGAASVSEVTRATSAPLGNTLANRILHPPASVAEIVRALAFASPDVLDSHGVSAEARDAVVGGDVETFLRLRGDFLRHHLSECFLANAEIGADDSPAIDSLEELSA